MVSMRTHNALDYAAAGFLLFAPTIFDFESLPPARNAFVLIGTFVLIYSLLTNCSLSLLDLFPFSVHAFLDVLSGMLLAFSPWLFDYREELSAGILQLHLGCGAALVILAAATRYREMTGAVHATPFRLNPRH